LAHQKRPVRYAGVVTRLDSWKEIATFLKRGIRTVQRWEREEGLPVHRLAHAKRGTVYADPAELASWWDSRRLIIERREPAEAPAPEQSQRAPQPAAPATSNDTLTRITNVEAVSVYPALSSDGRLLAYVSDRGEDGGPPQVWLQQIGGEALQLTTGQRECMDVSFSADDTRVLYTALGADGQLAIYDVPTLGGTPRLLKRRARNARMSPDGQWLMWLSLSEPSGIRVARVDGSHERGVAAGFEDVMAFTWSPSSDRLLVLGRADAPSEAEVWLASLDGRLTSTGIAASARRQGVVTWLPMPIAWTGDALLFCAVSRSGPGVFRQRLTESCAPIGDTERMSPISSFAWFPAAAAAGRIAFLLPHPDMNLWSIAIDEHTGAAFGPLRRLSRGPGIQNFLSTTSDGRFLFHAVTRSATLEILRRDLQTGAELSVPIDPSHPEAGYPAISPSGRQLAYATRSTGPHTARPVFILDLVDHQTRPVCEDAGGRPRQWLDERFLVIETFGTRLSSILLLDTTTGERRELIASHECSIGNPRVSPDGRWIAFDAARPGGSPNVFAAPLQPQADTPESSWTLVAASASHPFWSRNGQMLYYLTTTPYLMLRREVRARRFAPDMAPGDVSIATLREGVVPTFLNGTTPVTAPDQIVFLLGDFRGDLWYRDA